MPIRPMDMQVALPRVSEVKESKASFLHRDDISHGNANKSLQQEALKKQKSVNKTEASSKSRVDEKKKRKKKKRERDADKQKKDEKNPYDQPYHSIDIKI